MSALPMLTDSAHFVQTSAAEELSRDALALARTDSLMRAMRVLEDGIDLYFLDGSRWLGILPEAHKQRLRDLRERLVERDLYEFIYGPLPEGACNPESRICNWQSADGEAGGPK